MKPILRIFLKIYVVFDVLANKNVFCQYKWYWLAYAIDRQSAASSCMLLKLAKFEVGGN